MDGFKTFFTQVTSRRNLADEVAECELKQETDLYKRDILEANMKLKKPNSTVEEKIREIRKIGVMSWTGGPSAAKFAKTYLVGYLEWLGDPEQPDNLRIALLKSIVEISWLNDEIKATLSEKNILKTISNILDENTDTYEEIQRWAAYTLLCLATGSHIVQRELLKIDDLEPKLRKLSLDSWYYWKINAAGLLTQLLDLKEVTISFYDAVDHEDPTMTYW